MFPALLLVDQDLVSYRLLSESFLGSGSPEVWSFSRIKGLEPGLSSGSGPKALSLRLGPRFWEIYIPLSYSRSM